MNSSYRVRELSLAKLIKKGFEVYKKEISEIIKVIMIINIPIIIINTMIIQSVESTLIAVVLHILVTFISTVGSLSVVLIIANSIQNTEMDLKLVLLGSFKQWKSIIVTTILFIIIIGLLAFFFFIPGIIGIIYCSFYYQSIILKDKSGFQALGYSKNLVDGYWWKVFAIVIIMIGSSVCINQIGSLLIGNIDFLKAIINIIQQFVMYLFLSIETLLFLNLDFIKNR